MNHSVSSFSQVVLTQIDASEPQHILARAKEIIYLEQEALRLTSEHLNESFVKAIHILHHTKGRIIITGVGKSGSIGQKIASTLRSTGTKAYFIHSSEAAHGDLGSIDSTDTVIALSNSGSTPEILTILPNIKRVGATLIAITGNLESTLAKKADVSIVIMINREACSLNLAPTCSTTAMLAVGDCIALVLSELKGFKIDDFAFYHPGGNLGKKLCLTVKDVLNSPDAYPVALATTPLTEVVASMTKAPYGGINIINNEIERLLIGIITDGDIRRALLRPEEFFKLRAEDVMSKNPCTTTLDTPLVQALDLMENRPSQISVLSVVDENGKVLGILRLHDILSP